MLMFSLTVANAEDFSTKKLQVLFDSNFFLNKEINITYLNANYEYMKNLMKIFIASDLKIKDTSLEDFTLSQSYISYYFRKGIDIKGGKQRCSIGRGLIWNPIDIIDLPESFLPEYISEGKWGVDIGLMLHPKISSSIAMYFDNKKALFFNKYEVYLPSIDMILLCCNDKEDKFHLGLDFIRKIIQNIYFHANGDIYKDNGEIDWRAERGIRFISPKHSLYIILSYLNNSQGYKLERNELEGISGWIGEYGEYLGIGLSKYNISLFGGDLNYKVLYTMNLDNSKYFTNVSMTWQASRLSFITQYFHSSMEEIIKITVGYHLF